MSNQTYFESAGRLVSQPSPDTLEQYAREHLGLLYCERCKGKPMMTNGLAEGRLRLKCKSCHATCYAYKHPEVRVSFGTHPTVSYDAPIPPTPSLVRQVKVNKGFIEQEYNQEKDENMMQSDLWDSLPQDDKLQFLYVQSEANSDSLEAMQNTTHDIKKEMLHLKQLMAKTFEKLDAISLQLQQQNKATLMSPTHQSGALSHTSTAQQDHATMHERDTWRQVAMRSRGVPPLPRADPSLASKNRFEALQQSIPAYRGMSYEEYSIPSQTEARMTQRSSIRSDLSKKQIDRVKNGFSSKPISRMVILYFRGMKRNRISEVKSMFKSIAIPPHWVRNISFLGRSIMELTTFQDRKDEIISKLDKYEIHIMEGFDPLSTENLKDARKFSGLDEAQKKEMAERLYRTRLQKIIERLPKSGVQSRLRNFLNVTLNPKSLTAEAAHSDNLVPAAALQG